MKKSFRHILFSAVCSLLMIFSFGSCQMLTDDSSNDGNKNLAMLALLKSASSGGGDSLSAGGVYSTLTSEKKASTAPSTAGTITVTGGATYTGTSLSAAWSAIQSATADVTMTLAAGTYETTSQLSYSGSHNIKISGDSSTPYGTNVVIHGNLGTNSQNSRELLFMTSSSSGSLTLEYVTIKNDFAMTSTSDVQAEAIATAGTGNLACYNCSFLSGQDTIRTVAKAWFYKCYIEGDVDFLWMETTGSVALYEECVIRAIADRVTNAYITAPRAALTTKVGKGLVIYKSTIEAEGGLGSNFYLGRNPWSSSALSSYYNQVAVVDSPLYLGSGASLNATIWKSASNGTADKQYVGFKTDDYYAASTKTWGSRLSHTVENAEYSGRRNILNRIYNTGSKKFAKDTDKEWDIDTVISNNSWTVTADTSSALLSGETALTSVTYNYNSSSANGFTDTTVSNFSSHSSGSATGNANATITVPITGKCVVYVTGFYSGYGTIKAGTQGEAFYDFNNNSTGSTLEKAYVVYDASATSVVVTASTSSYITKIVVEYDNSLNYVPVTGVSVSASSSTHTVGVPITLSASVTPDTASNRDIKWTSNNTTVGTINEFTGVVTFVAAGAVTFTATARDGSGSAASITCNPTAATWTSAEWYDTKDSSATATSGNGTGLGGSAGTNNTVFTLGTTSGVTLGGNKTVTLIDGTSKNISTGLKMNSSGTISFSITSAGKVTVMAGYCADNNVTSDTVGITASNGGSATAWNANPTSTPTADATYTWTLSAGSYTIGRAGSGYAPAIYYVRVDIGTFTDTSSASSTSTVSESSATVSWDLSSSSVNIQQILGNLKGSVTGSTSYTVRAIVDATVSSGKLQGNGSQHAQMNNGTIIKVPVTNGAVVSVTASSAGAQYALYTIAGTAASTSSLTSTYTHSGSAAWISIVATGTAYPAAIEITGLNLTSLPDAIAENYGWDNAAIVADSASVNGTTGYYDNLYIDASSGKFAANNTSWTQCNAGTVIYVPMNGAGTVSFTTYGAYTITGGTSTDLSTTGSAAVSYAVSEGDLVTISGVKYAKITFTTGGYIKNLARTY